MLGLLKHMYEAFDHPEKTRDGSKVKDEMDKFEISKFVNSQLDSIKNLTIFNRNDTGLG